MISPTISLRRSLALAATLLSVACGGGGRALDPDADGTGGSYQIGEVIDPSACAVDVDCPIGYRCVGNLCRPLDFDLDNDGFDLTVDCNDDEATVSPSRPEICNGVDDNCNDDIDEGVLNACGVCGALPAEICDLVDNDCNGAVDDGCVVGDLTETEPNDGAELCQHIALPPNEGDTVTFAAGIAVPGDLDSYCFDVEPGLQLTFDVNAQSLGSQMDGVLALFDATSGTQLPGGFNDYQVGVGPDPYLAYTFADGGPVRLNIYNFEQDRGGPTYTYVLEIATTRLVICSDPDLDGVSNCEGDCENDDGLIFPNQTEVCDGIDNNCDDNIDDGCPSIIALEREPNQTPEDCELLTVPFTRAGAIATKSDFDLFCFFSPGNTRIGFDIDANEMGSPVDSQLALASVTGMPLPSTPVKTNDDGRDPDTGFEDTDSDSYLTYTFVRPGIYSLRVDNYLSVIRYGPTYTYTLIARIISGPSCVDNDGDGVSTCEGDCGDADPAIHFGAAEVCDGKDNDCDGLGDEGTCGEDFDGDGASRTQGDCDDDDPTRYPAATEICNGVDDDCNDEIDEGVRNACGTCGHAPAEICADSLDNDCDGVTDADCTEDLDLDTYTPNQGDCDDNDATVSPIAAEVCDNADNDCDGLVDEFVKNSCGVCGPAPAEECDGEDDNCNGEIDEGVLNACGECGPEPVETCDGLDNDCDTEVDENLLNGCGLCGPLPAEVCDWQDNNCDTFVDEGCDVQGDADGQTRRQGDCNDNDPLIYWGAAELCDDKDNDCDGAIDDAPACVPTEIEPNNTRPTCTPMVWPGRVDGIVTASNDVDYWCFTTTVADTRIGFDIEARDLASPLDSLIEIYDSTGTRLAANNNGVDPQTGILTADSYIDFVLEAAGNYTVLVRANAGSGAGSFYQLHTTVLGGCLDLDTDGINSCGGDCNDFNASIGPGGVDVCDGADNNCDGQIDERCVGTCLDDTSEQNDTLPTATVILANDPTHPLTYCGGDSDHYALDLTGGDEVQVDALFLHAEVNLSLEVFDTDGFTLLGESRSADDDEQVIFTAPTTGRYFIRMSGPLATSGSYGLLVRSPPP